MTIKLNTYLVKEEFSQIEYSKLIKSEELGKDEQITEFSIGHNLSGKFFLKENNEKHTKWKGFVEDIVGESLDSLYTHSTSAVLVLKVESNLFVFTFGYGRYLLHNKYFVVDFGIKTALNTLQHDSLKSVDLFTIDEEPLQRKAQSLNNSKMNAFGIDVAKDALRAVTGKPKKDILFNNISGADDRYSFSVEKSVKNLPTIALNLKKYYESKDYLEEFEWVDNIQRVKDSSRIAELDKVIVNLIKKNKIENINIILPEVLDLDEIIGFSFTRTKSEIDSEINSKKYFNNIDKQNFSIEKLKSDSLYISNQNDDDKRFSIYKALYAEYSSEGRIFILFSSYWYSIKKDFLSKIDESLVNIPISKLKFPLVKNIKVDKVNKKTGKVEIYKTGENKGQSKTKDKFEDEGEYNERVVNENKNYYLLDKKLIKSSTKTTPIELCDLLTKNGEFIHVKHKKGGSAGLSHLFAQGMVSAEVMLGDKDFRKKARIKLRNIDNDLDRLVPLEKKDFKSSDIEIVYLILGEESTELVKKLPFFTKINLSKVYQSLSERGFRMSIVGVGKLKK